MSNTLSTNFQDEIKASVDKTLLVEARKNELIITKVRWMILALITLLNYYYYTQSINNKQIYTFDISNVYLAFFWLSLATIIYLSLRANWYREWLHIALPTMDGVLVFSLFINIFFTAETIAAALPAASNSSIACAVLAISGALRLNRIAPFITTSLAILTVITISYLVETALLSTVFTCGLLLGIGMLGMRMSSVVKRSIEGEVARLVLGRFLPEEIINSAHNSPLATVAEPKRLNATVLITDIRGFTAFSENLPPEEVLEHLNLIQGTLADVVHEHGGRVDKFMGDGMLAVFGDSEQTTDHAYKAIITAIALDKATHVLNVKHNMNIKIGIGLHSGPIVVGCLGSGMRLEFTVLGDTVNTASRLESMTKEKNVDILISDESRLASLKFSSDKTIDFKSLGQVSIRGKKSTLDVYTID